MFSSSPKPFDSSSCRITPGSAFLRPAIAAILLVFGCSFAFAGPAQHIGVQRLLQQDGMPQTVTRDPASGALIALREASVLLAGARTEPAEALRAWVLEHAPAFGLTPVEDDIRVEQNELLVDGRHRIQLRQYWHGLPVEGADARGLVDADGRLRFLAANFRPELSAAIEPGILGEQAVRIAARAIGGSPVAGGPELWLRPDEHSVALAWRVRLILADGREARSWVDAASGRLLVSDELCSDAVGLVYPSDPAGPLAEVTLPRLLPGSGLLSKAFAVVDELQPPAVPLGPGGDYRYPPTHPTFEQVNVYWHADRFLNEFMAGLGYAGPPDSLILRVNMALDPYVAITSGRYVSFGRPIPGFVGLVSRSQDIIYHELTHAVIFGMGVLATGNRREASALHEALADYFAAAYTGDPGIAQWLYLTFPTGATRLDQPADPWNYDHYDQVGFAGGGTGSQWGNGMILSSGLWDLRERIGASADSLVLESLTYLPSSPVWAQFANAMLQADVDHHGGRLQPEILRALLARKLRGVVEAVIEGPLTVLPGTPATFRARACCGSTLLGRYQWRSRNWCRGRPCTGWQDMAEGLELQATFEEDTELQLTVLSPWSDTLVSTPFFVAVRPPQLDISGPRRIAQHGVGTWSARVAAVGPASLQWSRSYRVPVGAPLRVVLGSSPAQTFAADTSCDLEVTLVDGLGRRVARPWVVETFRDQPPPNRTGRFLVAQRFDAGMRQAEVSLELTAGSGVSAIVYDVRGRERVRVWNGPLSSGVHLLRWDAGELESGVYYLRVLANPAGAVQRFAIVR